MRGAGRPQAGYTALISRKGVWGGFCKPHRGKLNVLPEKNSCKDYKRGVVGTGERRLRSWAGSVCSVIKSCQAKLIFSVDRVTRLVDEGNGVCRES